MMKVLVTKSLNKATKLSLPESINGLAWDCTPTCCVIDTGYVTCYMCIHFPLTRMPSIVDHQKRKEKRAAEVDGSGTGMSAKKPRLHVSSLHH